MTCPRCSARHALYRERDECTCLYCGHVQYDTPALPYVRTLEMQSERGWQIAARKDLKGVVN
jgi:hypothetical protein